MLKPRRAKQKGYARIVTRVGALSIELRPEFAPRAVWNFVQLAKRGYYDGVVFHRNIRHFMIQGGDPTGTGKGGRSVWGKNFADELDGPLSHDARGVVSMANKGRDTNSSQFFVTYRPAKHLDRKHTIFGQVVDGMDALDALERLEVRPDDKRPVEDVAMQEVSIFVDPFEEFRKAKSRSDREEREKEEIARMGGTEDDRVTWTGKRVRDSAGGGGGGIGPREADTAGIGKYLKDAEASRSKNENGHGGGTAAGDEDELVHEDGSKETRERMEVEEWELETDSVPEPARKKAKGASTGGFGNFDNW